MKSKNWLPFESLGNEQYIRYLERAEMFHEKDLHTDKTVIQLANILYEKEMAKNESKIN